MSRQELEARVLQLTEILRNNRIPVPPPAVLPLTDPSPTLHDASIADNLLISPAPLEESAENGEDNVLGCNYEIKLDLSSL